MYTQHSIHTLSEDLQATFLETGKLDNTQHSRVVNMMRRHMRTLGLFTAAPKPDDDDAEDGELDPLEYVKRGRSRMKLEED
jgi:hypothetical protein